MTAARLDVGPGLQLPLEAVTQTFGLVGKRGVGKTHGAAVLAEEMLEHKLQVVILDPIGVWWGLRSSADGKASGHPILVLGGEHGDLPLEAVAGKLVADFVVSKAASVVLDLGEFSKSDQARFVTDFLERVYQRNRAPMHLVIDEADAFAPQRLHPGAQRCFGAVDTVVRRGRARGLGVTLVTQRSAAINKDVLTQIEVLVAFRTIAPQDRAAIEAWIEVHADRVEAKAVLQSLASLEIGEAWVWSPAWLGKLARVRIRRRRTFDSSATPEVGKVARAPKTVAPVDVEALRGELASLATKADAEDPRRLRARIATLEREAAAKPMPTPAAPAKRVEVPVLSGADVKRLEAVAERSHALAQRVGELIGKFGPDRWTPPEHIPFRTTTATVNVRLPIRAHRAPAARMRVPRTEPDANGAVLDRAQRAVLIVLAQHPEGCSLPRIAVLTGYAPRGGGFLNALSRLRATGLLEGSNAGTMRITDAGAGALGNGWDPLPSGAALVRYWLEHRSLGAAERAVFAQLVDVPAKPLTLAELAQRTGYAPKGGGFINALSRLRTIGLLEGRNSEPMRASAHLFD